MVLQLRAVDPNSMFVLSRDDLLAVMEHLANAVTSVDEAAGQALVHGRSVMDVGHVIDGWGLSAESGTVILHVVPRNLGGHYVLNVEQASALWRSLAAAYWRADDHWQEELWQAFFGDADLSGGSL